MVSEGFASCEGHSCDCKGKSYESEGSYAKSQYPKAKVCMREFSLWSWEGSLWRWEGSLRRWEGSLRVGSLREDSLQEGSTARGFGVRGFTARGLSYERCRCERVQLWEGFVVRGFAVILSFPIFTSHFEWFSINWRVAMVWVLTDNFGSVILVTKRDLGEIWEIFGRYFYERFGRERDIERDFFIVFVMVFPRSVRIMNSTTPWYECYLSLKDI